MGALYHDEAGLPIASAPHVSWFRRCLNVLGCLLSLPLYWMMMESCRLPVTLDLMTTIALAELNRFVNEGRRMKLWDQMDRDLAAESVVYDEKTDPEKLPQPCAPRLDCMAAVVGWREDPGLFTRALESYRGISCCKFLLVGIDGDDLADLDMARVFNKVYPKNSKTIHIPQPFGEIAEQVRAKLIKNSPEVSVDQIDSLTLQYCVQLARTLLQQHDVQLGGDAADRTIQLCLRQKHLHKKSVMFTSYVFSLVIADELGLEFLWSSDSDTIVFPDSLGATISSIAADDRIGGASSGLVVHNGQETAVSNLAATVYFGELYLTRSTSAAVCSSDCQSGPSTLFRIAALPPILVPWYLQTIMGKRMVSHLLYPSRALTDSQIINEDRHLTTNLLARGWRVVFTSDVLTATDTPTTLARWVKQQVRWARATHIESLLQPKVYLMSHPLLFYGMAKRELGPVIGLFAVLYYLFHGRSLVDVSALDLVLRVLVSSAYNLARNPHRLPTAQLKWLVPGVLFYHIPLPAVHVWSMLTPLADGWGTTMRASGERQKKDSTRQAWWEGGFFVVWMAVVAGAALRWWAAQFGFQGPLEWVPVLLAMAAAAYTAWRLTVHTMTSE